MPYWFDGNNLIGQTAAQARSDRETRRAFLRLLSDRASMRGGHFTVYFDGDDAVGPVAPRGVRVRFSAPLSADDAILQGLAGARNPAEITVVTNDAGLRSRCRDEGARTMDWREFTSRMKRVSPGREDRAEKEEPGSVDAWARYFGFDDDSLD